MNKNRIVAVFLTQVILVNGTCILEKPESSQKQPFVFQNIGREKLFYPDDLNVVLSNERLTIVCPEGFEKYRVQGVDPYYRDLKEYNVDGSNATSISIYCSSYGSIHVENNLIDSDSSPISGDKSLIGGLQCKEFNWKTLEAPSGMCKKSNFAMGLSLDNEEIVLGEFCYDLDNLKLEHVHYVAGARSPVLSRQRKFNASNRTLLHSIGNSVPSDSYFLSESELSTGISGLLGTTYELQYVYASLIPASSYKPNFGRVAEYLNKSFDRAIWWRPLLNGNWRIFERLLSLRSKSVPFDVYAGASGTVSGLVDGNTNYTEPMMFEKNGITQSVPKYIWNYLKSRDGFEELVVVAYNAPYFEVFPENQIIFCEDVCEDYDWLQPMEKVRKISAFGYIFCCDEVSVEVKQHLSGFPELKIEDSEVHRTVETSPAKADDEYEDEDNYVYSDLKN